MNWMPYRHGWLPALLLIGCQASSPGNDIAFDSAPDVPAQTSSTLATEDNAIEMLVVGMTRLLGSIHSTDELTASRIHAETGIVPRLAGGPPLPLQVLRAQAAMQPLSEADTRLLKADYSNQHEQRRDEVPLWSYALDYHQSHPETPLFFHYQIADASRIGQPFVCGNDPHLYMQAFRDMGLRVELVVQDEWGTQLSLTRTDADFDIVVLMPPDSLQCEVTIYLRRVLDETAATQA